MIKTLLGLCLALSAHLSFAAVDLNKATAADLDSIKGIGPSTSSRILSERKSAPFKDWQDFIQRVPGIGDKRAAQLSTHGLTVNGSGYKAPATARADTAAKPAR